MRRRVFHRSSRTSARWLGGWDCARHLRRATLAYSIVRPGELCSSRLEPPPEKRDCRAKQKPAKGNINVGMTSPLMDILHTGRSELQRGSRASRHHATSGNLENIQDEMWFTSFPTSPSFVNAEANSHATSMRALMMYERTRVAADSGCAPFGARRLSCRFSTGSC